jgi:hypothetical protein
VVAVVVAEVVVVVVAVAAAAVAAAIGTSHVGTPRFWPWSHHQDVPKF